MSRFYSSLCIVVYVCLHTHKFYAVYIVYVWCVLQTTSNLSVVLRFVSYKKSQCRNQCHLKLHHNASFPSTKIDLGEE